MADVYVLTKAKPFQKEEFVDVFSTNSEKTLLKYLRKISPYVKADANDSYVIKDGNDITLYFLHKTTVKD